jgi:hypothetical protein
VESEFETKKVRLHWLTSGGHPHGGLKSSIVRFHRKAWHGSFLSALYTKLSLPFCLTIIGTEGLLTWNGVKRSSPPTSARRFSIGPWIGIIGPEVRWIPSQVVEQDYLTLVLSHSSERAKPLSVPVFPGMALANPQMKNAKTLAIPRW